MMTGVVKVGTATGQMVLPPLTALLMAAIGWRYSALALGYGAAALLLFAAYWMEAPPRSRSSARPMERRGPPFAEVRRSRAFWTLCAAQFLFYPSLVTVPLHIAVHGIDLGMTRTTAAILLSVIGGSSVVGRMTVGTLIDRIGGRNAYVLSLVPLVAGLLALLVVETHWPLFAVVALYGFAHGGLFTVVSPTVAEFFGTRAHGAVFGGVVFFGTIGRGDRADHGGPDLRRHRQLCLRLHGSCGDGRDRSCPGAVATAAALGAACRSLSRTGRRRERNPPRPSVRRNR